MTRVDLGDRAHGRVCDPQTLHVTRPPRYMEGVVTGMFPNAPRVVTVTTAAGDTRVIRLPQGVTS